MRKSWQALAIGAVAIVVMTVLSAPSAPRADIRILTHDTADRAPRRVQAAIDLGVVAISVLVTWSGQLSR